MIKQAISIGLFNSYFSQPNSVAEIKPTVSIVNPKPESYIWSTANLNLSKLLNHSAPYEALMEIYVENLLDEEVHYPKLPGAI